MILLRLHQVFGLITAKMFFNIFYKFLSLFYLNNGFIPRYISANNEDNASIYLFSIGYKNRKWEKDIQYLENTLSNSIEVEDGS